MKLHLSRYLRTLTLIKYATTVLVGSVHIYRKPIMHCTYNVNLFIAGVLRLQLVYFVIKLLITIRGFHDTELLSTTSDA